MENIFKILLLFGLYLTVCYGRYAEDEASLQKLALRWRKEYKVVYRSRAEEKKRFHIFRMNVKEINLLNDLHKGDTEFALNQFADLTKEEFRAKSLMPKRKWPIHEKCRYIRHSLGMQLPASFDWTQKGAVTPVKDQGSAGSCWAFSTVENIEGQWQLSGKPLTNLSVEQVVECDGTQDPKDDKADCGVFGGWPFLAYQYVMKAGGLETWEDFWYCSGLGGKPGTCEVCPAAGYNWTLCGPPIPYCNMTQSCYAKIDPKKFVPGLKVVDWKAIDQNETIIAEQLMTIGPLSVALDAELLQFYHKGVFDPIFCSKTSLDHAVLMVGFGTEKDLFRTKPYWKIKNSWGPKWGENGYFRIYRGAGTCGINTQVTTAILQK